MGKISIVSRNSTTFSRTKYRSPKIAERLTEVVAGGLT